LKKAFIRLLAVSLSLALAFSLNATAFAADYTTPAGEAYKAKVIGLLPAGQSAAAAEINAIKFSESLQGMQELQTAIQAVLTRRGVSIEIPAPTGEKFNFKLTAEHWTARGNKAITISGDMQRRSLTLAENEMLFAAPGKLLTLTVDGVERTITPGETYTGDVRLSLTQDISGSPLGSYTGRGGDPYRTALYVGPEGKEADLSVDAAVLEGIAYDSLAEGLKVIGKSNDFSGVIVKDRDYIIQNADIELATNSTGKGDVNDFSGIGAAVSVLGNSKVQILNSKIRTSGVAKVGLFVDDGADTLMKNSKLNVMGGTLYDGYYNTAYQPRMVSPPWVLGINGNARSTNLMGSGSTSSFVDVDSTAGGWGVLSTDAGSNMVLNVVNSVLTLADDQGNIKDGYGAYVIGNADETFYGTTFNVGTYAAIMTGGKARFTSSKGIDKYTFKDADGNVTFANVTSEREDGPTVVNSGAFGVMAHNSGTTIVERKSVFNTKNATFLIKAGAQTITVDDAVLKPADGVLLQLIDNDDSAIGLMDPAPEGFGMPTFNTVYNEPAGFPGFDYAVAGQTLGESDTDATFSNVTLTGSMYNGTGYWQGMGGVQSAKAMNITLDKASLTGAISATSVAHWYDGQQAASFPEAEYYKLGHVANRAYYNGYNTVSVTLTSGSAWNVSKTSVLTKLTISSDSSVSAAYATIDGKAFKPEAGQTYSGIIILSPTAVTRAYAASGASATPPVTAAAPMMMGPPPEA
jgi:hypothetical protein